MCTYQVKRHWPQMFAFENQALPTQAKSICRIPLILGKTKGLSQIFQFSHYANGVYSLFRMALTS